MNITLTSMPRQVLVWAMRLLTLYLACAATVFLFVYNPVNWRLYSTLTMWDWVWLWMSDIGSAVFCFGSWWFLQRWLTKLIIHEKSA